MVNACLETDFVWLKDPKTLWAVFTSDLPFDFFPWIPRSFLTFANQLYKDTTQKS